MHYACRHGHLDAVSLLISKGAHVNCRTASGHATPIHRAAFAGHSNVVKMLIGAVNGLHMYWKNIVFWHHVLILNVRPNYAIHFQITAPKPLCVTLMVATLCTKRQREDKVTPLKFYSNGKILIPVTRPILSVWWTRKTREGGLPRMFYLLIVNNWEFCLLNRHDLVQMPKQLALHG